MSAKLTTIIVDDEPLARGLLRSHLQEFDCVDIVAECKNGREALKRHSELLPDLMFLDIQMPGINGVEVVKAIQVELMPMIVFTTAYEKYAVEAFAANAVDYLLKPIEEHQIERAIKRCLERVVYDVKMRSNKHTLIKATEQLSTTSEASIVTESEHSTKLAIKDGREIDLVDIDKIDWVDAAGDLMCIHSGGKTYVMRSTMKALMQQLPQRNFKRIHRSTIVNLQRIQKLVPHIKGEYFIYLNCGTKLKVSRGFKEVINEFLAAN